MLCEEVKDLLSEEKRTKKKIILGRVGYDEDLDDELILKKMKKILTKKKKSNKRTYG